MLPYSQDNMHKLIQAYLDEAPISYRTISTYRVYLGYFSGFLEERKIDPAEVTATQIKKWIEHKHWNWSENTRRIAHTAIRSFLRHTFGDDHPALKMRVRKVDVAPQRTLTADQVKTLLASIDTTKPQGIRNKAMLMLMLDTGLRANEVCSLQLKRLDLQERTLQVRIKGGEWGTGVFTETTAGWLEYWRKIREDVAKPGVQAVFVSIKGTKPGTAITRDGLRSIFRRLGSQSSLGLISPHDLRRTFATLAIKNGAPTRLVQIAGRWKNIREVERYTQALNASDLEPYSPITNIFKDDQAPLDDLGEKDEEEPEEETDVEIEYR